MNSPPLSDNKDSMETSTFRLKNKSKTISPIFKRRMAHTLPTWMRHLAFWFGILRPIPIKRSTGKRVRIYFRSPLDDRENVVSLPDLHLLFRVERWQKTFQHIIPFVLSCWRVSSRVCCNPGRPIKFLSVGVCAFHVQQNDVVFLEGGKGKLIKYVEKKNI